MIGTPERGPSCFQYGILSANRLVVIRMLIKGWSNRKIAEFFEITPRSVQLFNKRRQDET